MGKKLVSRYVTLGFDREGDADKFLKMIEGNGLLLQLYKRIKDDDGNPKGQVTNIQARSAHEWTPSRLATVPRLLCMRREGAAPHRKEPAVKRKTK